MNAIQNALVIFIIVAVIVLWQCKPKSPIPAHHLMIRAFKIDASGIDQVAEGRDNIMLKLKVGDKRTLKIQPFAIVKDADGNDQQVPTTFDGIPAWASSDSTAVTVTPSEDGYTAVIESIRAASSAQISVTGDGAHDDTVVEITGTLDVTVSALDAIGVNIDVLPVDTAPTE